MAGSIDSYIDMVHRLIETCIVYNLSKEESMEALHKYANIKPTFTATVWNQLEKENKDFFELYKKKREERATIDVAETSKRIQQIALDSDSDSGYTK